MPDDATEFKRAVQALVVDPTNTNVVYAGTVNGGVWKTTNANAANPNWVPLTDQKLPALSIQSIAISPVNPNVRPCPPRLRQP